MLVLLFAEKWGLDALSKPKSYNSVLEDLSGQENSFGKALNITTDVLYFLVAVEVLLIGKLDPLIPLMKTYPLTIFYV